MTEVPFVERLKTADKELASAQVMVQGLDVNGTIRSKLNMAREYINDLLAVVEEVHRIAPGDLPGQDS